MKTNELGITFNQFHQNLNKQLQENYIKLGLVSKPNSAQKPLKSKKNG